MAAVHGTVDPGKQRPGVCHRCGWKGLVSKVSRRQRKQLRTGHTFGRLCRDCLIELAYVASIPADQKKPARLKAVRNRKVA